MAITRWDGYLTPATPDPYNYPLVSVPGGAVTINPADNVASVIGASPSPSDFHFTAGTFSTGLSSIPYRDGDRWFAAPQTVTFDGSSYSGQKVIDVPNGVNLEIYYARFSNWTVSSNHSSTIDARFDGWGDDPEVGGNHPRWNTNPGSLLLYGVEFLDHTDTSPGTVDNGWNGIGHAVQLGSDCKIVGGSYTGGASSGLAVNGHGYNILIEGATFTDWRAIGGGHHGMVKMVKTQDMVVRRCLFDNTASTTENTLLWFDVDAANILIEHNEFTNQRGYAIHLELGRWATVRANLFTDTGNLNSAYWGWNGSILFACYDESVVESNEFVNCYGALSIIDQSGNRNWGTEYWNGSTTWSWLTRETTDSGNPVDLNVAHGDGEWGPNTGTGPDGGNNRATSLATPIWGRIPTSTDGTPTSDHLLEWTTGGITFRNNDMTDCSRTSAGGDAVSTIQARADHAGHHGAADSRAYKIGLNENEIHGNLYSGTNTYRWYTGWAGNPNYDNVGDAQLDFATFQSMGVEAAGTRTPQTPVVI